jgi:hypothetical protein
MSNFFMWLFVYVFLGVPVLLFIFSAFAVASRSDDEIEEIFGDIIPPEKPRNVDPPRLPR